MSPALPYGRKRGLLQSITVKVLRQVPERPVAGGENKPTANANSLMLCCPAPQVSPGASRKERGGERK